VKKFSTLKDWFIKRLGNMKKAMKYWGVIEIYCLIVLSCSKDGDLNIFPKSKDTELGEQFYQELLANPSEYPILDENNNSLAYEHLNRIKDKLLQSDDLYYKEDFKWQVKIIDKDILNAFATPGGYMYFYSGLIKYLDNEAQFAGVMAHEMAHADLRHSTEMMTAQYGVGIVLNFVLGKDDTKFQEAIKSLALGLGTLKYSRNNEYEADEHAIKYMKDTDYSPKSTGWLFRKA
jgi:predicted Zn-dependent protease